MVLSGFWSPKWSQNASKIDHGAHKMHPKSTLVHRNCIWDDFGSILLPFWSILEPKSIQNRAKIETKSTLGLEQLQKPAKESNSNLRSGKQRRTNANTNVSTKALPKQTPVTRTLHPSYAPPACSFTTTGFHNLRVGVPHCRLFCAVRPRAIFARRPSSIYIHLYIL